MIDKKEAMMWIEGQLLMLNINVMPCQYANMYTFTWKGKEYLLHHRHKKEKGSLLCHITEDSLTAMRHSGGEQQCPCMAYSMSYENLLTGRKELYVLIATIENIYEQLANPYNKAIIRGKTTGNIIFKYGTDLERNILDESCDILTARLVLRYDSKSKATRTSCL